MQMTVPLSRLMPSRRNPRKVKPGREAHQRLVALIRSQGLLQPLVVRPLEGKRFEVVAGERRLRALREIHKDNGDPKIPCVLRDVDPVTADALSLGENFGREAMHPLDEAESMCSQCTFCHSGFNFHFHMSTSIHHCLELFGVGMNDQPRNRLVTEAGPQLAAVNPTPHRRVRHAHVRGQLDDEPLMLTQDQGWARLRRRPIAREPLANGIGRERHSTW